MNGKAEVKAEDLVGPEEILAELLVGCCCQVKKAKKKLEKQLKNLWMWWSVNGKMIVLRMRACVTLSLSIPF